MTRVWIWKWAKRALFAFAVVLLLVGGAYAYFFAPHHSSAPPESAEGLLDRADTLSWGNRWADALPLYIKAEQLFRYQKQPAKALYAHVSQVPPDERGSVSEKLLALISDLAKPEAHDEATRLRILTIRGMLETNYDAAEARSTWQEVEKLALHMGQMQLATRAIGEQGIAAFLLGDTETAKKQVVKAWTLSKVERDPAATVRYASVFGAGLVQLHNFKEALTPLNLAINLATSNHDLAYPSIAVYAKIDALTGLKQYDEALTLANSSLARLGDTPYEQHKEQVYLSRGGIYGAEGNWPAAVNDFKSAFMIAQTTQNYRGVTDSAGQLADAYEHTNDLSNALNSINTAIEANTHIPGELYLVPRNLLIKARILDKMGQSAEAEILYRKSMALVNGMLQHVPTKNIQRQLLSEMGEVYSSYFAFLTSRKRYDEALDTLEHARGSIETEAIEHHDRQQPHEATPEEKQLTNLNIDLINTDNPVKRNSLMNAIYTAELAITPSSLAQQEITHPVTLARLQKVLDEHTVLLEYVLAETNSYVLAVTRDKVVPYKLPAKSVIEADAHKYRAEVRGQKTDLGLAQQLFRELLKPIEEVAQKQDIVIVPDGQLHLLPFSALADDSGNFVLASHTISVSPSSTVYELLEERVQANEEAASLSYLGIAAWTQQTEASGPISRFFSEPTRNALVPLPDSKKEVETIAQELPTPRTILLGGDATETHFKKISSESTNVMHLALHGYADVDYPDRSALVFAPDPDHIDDGLLQVREIRTLHLTTKLVTLSACDTGVGPVGEGGVANIVNAFLEAGADSVVSTLWELEDHSAEHLMATFYAELAKGSTKAEALRQAQIEMMKSGVSPYYWASLQVVGDPNGKI